MAKLDRNIEKELWEILDKFRGTSIQKFSYAFIIDMIFYKYISLFGDELDLVIPSENSFTNFKYEEENAIELLKYNFDIIQEKNPILKDVLIGDYLGITNDKELWNLEFIYSFLNEESAKEADAKKSLRELFHSVFNLYERFKHKGAYTTNSVSDIISGVVLSELGDQQFSSIYDPAIGIGMLLLPFINDKTIVYGQDVSDTQIRLAIINLLIHGVRDFDLKVGDVINNPLHLKNDEMKKFDIVVSEPPFGLRPKQHNNSNSLSRLKEDIGISGKLDGNSYFLLHALESLNEEGMAAIVASNAFLFSLGKDKMVREYLVKNGLLAGVINLPTNIYSYTNLATSIFILSKKKNKDVLLIDASNEFVKEGFNHRITESNLNRIVSVWKSKEEIKDFSIRINYEDFKLGNYDLSASRYLYVPENEIKAREGYRLAKISEFVEIIQGEKSDDKTGPLLRMKNLSDDFTLSNLKSSEMETVEVRPNFRKVDFEALIMPRMISYDINKLGWFTPESENDYFFINPNFYSLKLDENKIEKDYLLIELLSDSVQQHIKSMGRGTTIPNISKKDLLSLVIQVPDEENNEESLRIQQSFVDAVKFQADKEKIEKHQLQDTIDKLKRQVALTYQSHLHNLRNNELGTTSTKLSILIDILNLYPEIGNIHMKELDKFNYSVVEYVHSINDDFIKLRNQLNKIFNSTPLNTQKEPINLFDFVRDYIDSQSIIEIEDDTIDYMGEDAVDEDEKPIINFDKNSLNSILDNIFSNIKQHSGIEDFKKLPNAIRVVYSFEEAGYLNFSIQNKGNASEITEELFFTRGEIAGKYGNTGLGGADIKEIAEQNEAKAFMNTYEFDSSMDYVFEVGFKIKLRTDEV